MSTVTLIIHLTNGGEHPVEMPGATSGKYAAKRAAEAVGLDPEQWWALLYGGHTIIPEDEAVAALDGQVFTLGLRNPDASHEGVRFV